MWCTWGAPLPGENLSPPGAAPVMLCAHGHDCTSIASSVFSAMSEYHRTSVAARTSASPSAPFYHQRRSMRWAWYLFFCYCVVALSRTRVRSYILATVPSAKTVDFPLLHSLANISVMQ